MLTVAVKCSGTQNSSRRKRLLLMLQMITRIVQRDWSKSGYVTNSIISCNLALLAPWGRRRSLNVHLVTLTYISILVEL